MQVRPLNVYEVKINGKKHIGTIEEVAAASGESEKTLWRLVNVPRADAYGELIGRQYPVFYLIERESEILVKKGTRQELADHLGIQVDSLYNQVKHKLLFADEYKFEDAIEESSAPVKSPKHTETRKVDFRLGSYAQSLYDAYFKRWRNVQ